MTAALFEAWTGIWTALERATVPPPSAYWRHEVERFYLHSTALRMVECVGRGGDKSRESVVMAIAEALAGDFAVPPGERHYYTHVSENREEAAKTLDVLQGYLRILAVPHSRAADTIELTELPRGFKVLAARVGAVSGWRCIGWTADECAKWSSDGADPSEEVIASIKAMSVTHPGARGRMISSPLATVGYFHETWAPGDTVDQVAGQAPTWIANPSVTEEQTHRLERDPRKHAREYGAKPSDGHEESLYASELIDRAMRASAGDVLPAEASDFIAAMDPSLGRNAFTLVVAGKRVVDGRPRASIVLARSWRAKSGEHLDMADMVETVAREVLPYTDTVVTDQFHGESLSSISSRLRTGLTIEVDKPTAAERIERYESLVARFLDHEIELPRDMQVRADLLAVRRRVVSGAADRFTIFLPTTADGRHADYCPAIVLALARARYEADPPWIEAMRSGRAKGFFGGPVLPQPPKPAPRAFPDHVEDVEKTSAWEHKKDGGSEWGKLANLLAGGEEPREKPPGTVFVEVGPGGGRATGEGTFYNMTCTWQGRSGDATFSANANETFKSEVLKKASAAGHQIS